MLKTHQKRLKFIQNYLRTKLPQQVARTRRITHARALATSQFMRKRRYKPNEYFKYLIAHCDRGNHPKDRNSYQKN